MGPGGVILRGAAGMVVLAGALIYNTGLVTVEVREKPDTHIWLAVPAIVLPVAAKLVPKEKLQDATRDLRPWLPTIEAASEALRDCPDASLVEVDDPGEHVRIAKQAGRLVIDVHSEDEDVHVSVPLGVLAYTAREMANEGPAA